MNDFSITISVLALGTLIIVSGALIHDGIMHAGHDIESGLKAAAEIQAKAMLEAAALECSEVTP